MAEYPRSRKNPHHQANHLYESQRRCCRRLRPTSITSTRMISLLFMDDMDMPVGQLRIRRKGSAGGHNGIKSITEHLGTDVFPRFKIGIGHPARNNKAVVNHVLHAFQGEDKTAIEAAVAEMATALEEWIKSGDIEEVMQAHNKKKPKAEKPAAE